MTNDRPMTQLPAAASLAAVPALAPTRFAGAAFPLDLDPARGADRARPSARPVEQPGARAARAPLVVTAVGGWASAVALLGAFLLGACNGPRVVHERPTLVTGDRVPQADGAREAARIAAEQQRMRDARDSAVVAASASCAPAVCAALARGEVALGMTEAQVRAATRSAPDAWAIRDAGATSVMVAASLAAPPADVVGEVAMVQLRDGRVASVSYREPQGVRVVQAPGDATTEGRARATAAALVREGDAFTAAGDRAAALDRYDRALVLVPDDAMLQYRVATLLDQQLRPVEALIRYQRFLNQLEIQRIDAIGNANAKLAEAIARAQQRIIVLERQAR